MYLRTQEFYHGTYNKLERAQACNDFTHFSVIYYDIWHNAASER